MRERAWKHLECGLLDLFIAHLYLRLHQEWWAMAWAAMAAMNFIASVGWACVL